MASSPNGDDTSSASSWSPEIKSRWRFSASQNDILEEAYQSNPNPSSEILDSLVTELHSPRKTIITWFQNRRAKQRRRQRQQQQQQQQQRRRTMRAHPSTYGSNMTATTDHAASYQQQEPFPVQVPENLSAMSIHVPLATTTMSTAQQLYRSHWPSTPLGVPPLPPSPLILSHEVSLHDIRNNGHLVDNRVAYNPIIPTEEWLSFSALWQYVYSNQPHCLSEEDEAHLTP